LVSSEGLKFEDAYRLDIQYYLSATEKDAQQKFMAIAGSLDLK
jgi:hypothetical protein